MPFTQQQAEEIKKQLFQEIENLPNANKAQIKEYIEGLNEIELEEFLEKNKIKISEKPGQEIAGEEKQEKPVFQLIVEQAIPSYKLGENEKALAILEINPLSYGHVLIIPKEKTTVEKMSKKAFILAQKLSGKIKSKLKPSEIKIETFSFQDYPAINVVPLYKDKPLKKEKAEEENLMKLQKILEVKKREPAAGEARKPSSSKKLPEVKSRVPRFS